VFAGPLLGLFAVPAPLQRTAVAGLRLVFRRRQNSAPLPDKLAGSARTEMRARTGRSNCNYGHGPPEGGTPNAGKRAKAPFGVPALAGLRGCSEAIITIAGQGEKHIAEEPQRSYIKHFKRMAAETASGGEDGQPANARHGFAARDLCRSTTSTNKEGSTNEHRNQT